MSAQACRACGAMRKCFQAFDQHGWQQGPCYACGDPGYHEAHDERGDDEPMPEYGTPWQVLHAHLFREHWPIGERFAGVHIVPDPLVPVTPSEVDQRVALDGEQTVSNWLLFLVARVAGWEWEHEPPRSPYTLDDDGLVLAEESGPQLPAR